MVSRDCSRGVRCQHGAQLGRQAVDTERGQARAGMDTGGDATTSEDNLKRSARVTAIALNLHDAGLMNKLVDEWAKLREEEWKPIEAARDEYGRLNELKRQDVVPPTHRQQQPDV